MCFLHNICGIMHSTMHHTMHKKYAQRQKNTLTNFYLIKYNNISKMPKYQIFVTTKDLLESA